MHFDFTVSVDVSHESGKFATREDIGEAIKEAIEGCDPDLASLGPEGDTVYNIDDLSVTDAM